MDEEILAAAREAQRCHRVNRRTLADWEREVGATEADPRERRRAAQALQRRAWFANREAHDRLRVLCGGDHSLYTAALNGALLEVAQ